MKDPVKIGAVGEIEFTVTEQHTIDFANAVMPAILSTPWLIWFLEHAAREAVLPLLDTQESTVGVNVEVDHIAPTPIGQKVRCQARVIFADGRIISFALRAWDEHELIATGTHKLRVIDEERLSARVRSKLS